MAYCAVKLCGKTGRKSNYQKDGITFHRFPKCPEKKSKWIDATFRGDKWFPSNYSVICSRHFTEDSFNIMKNRRRLMSSAVPTLYLPVLASPPLDTGTSTTARPSVNIEPPVAATSSQERALDALNSDVTIKIETPDAATPSEEMTLDPLNTDVTVKIETPDAATPSQEMALFSLNTDESSLYCIKIEAPVVATSSQEMVPDPLSTLSSFKIVTPFAVPSSQKMVAASSLTIPKCHQLPSPTTSINEFLTFPKCLPTSKNETNITNDKATPTRLRRFSDLPECPSAYDTIDEKRLCRRVAELTNALKAKNRKIKTLYDSNRRLKKQLDSLKSLLEKKNDKGDISETSQPQLKKNSFKPMNYSNQQ